MPYNDDRTRTERETRGNFGRKLVIHIAVALVASLGGVAGGIEITEGFDAECIEYDD